MAAILTREPAAVTAGDTLRWRREDLTSDYPASAGWVLSYELRASIGAHSFTATADGDAFAVTVSAASSAAFAPGIYALAGYVTRAGDRHEVARTTIEVKPNLATAGAADRRSHVRRVLEAVEATLEGRATRDQMSYTIGDRSLARMPVADLLKWRDAYRAELVREAAAENIAAGRPGHKRILVRFTG